MALMNYTLVQCLVVWEHSNVEQIVGMTSKMIGAIGSTYSARKEGIDQGLKDAQWCRSTSQKFFRFQDLKNGGRLLLYQPVYVKGCRAECGIYKE